MTRKKSCESPWYCCVPHAAGLASQYKTPCQTTKRATISLRSPLKRFIRSRSIGTMHIFMSSFLASKFRKLPTFSNKKVRNANGCVLLRALVRRSLIFPRCVGLFKNDFLWEAQLFKVCYWFWGLNTIWAWCKNQYISHGGPRWRECWRHCVILAVVFVFCLGFATNRHVW